MPWIIHCRWTHLLFKNQGQYPGAPPSPLENFQVELGQITSLPAYQVAARDQEQSTCAVAEDERDLTTAGCMLNFRKHADFNIFEHKIFYPAVWRVCSHSDLAAARPYTRVSPLLKVIGTVCTCFTMYWQQFVCRFYTIKIRSINTSMVSYCLGYTIIIINNKIIKRLFSHCTH